MRHMFDSLPQPDLPLALHQRGISIFHAPSPQSYPAGIATSGLIASSGAPMGHPVDVSSAEFNLCNDAKQPVLPESFPYMQEVHSIGY